MTGSSRKMYWMQSDRMVVTVTVDNGLIIEAAPIVKKFVGQPILNLINWMERQGGFKMLEMDAML